MPGYDNYCFRICCCCCGCVNELILTLSVSADRGYVCELRVCMCLEAQRQNLAIGEDEERKRQLDQHHYFVGQFVIVKKHQMLVKKGTKTISAPEIHVNADSEDMLGGTVRWLPGQQVDSSDFIVPQGFIVIVCTRISMSLHLQLCACKRSINQHNLRRQM